MLGFSFSLFSNTPNETQMKTQIGPSKCMECPVGIGKGIESVDDSWNFLLNMLCRDLPLQPACLKGKETGTEFFDGKQMHN